MHFEPIELAKASDPRLLELLRAHPHIQRVELDSDEKGLTFFRGDRKRHVSAGTTSSPLMGLVELADNNPLVCADEFSVPDAASTLALIALGPLVTAGLIHEPPVFITNMPSDEATVLAFLATQGYAGEITLAHEEIDSKELAVGTAIVAVNTDGSGSELDDLYAESFGRSFCVEMADQDTWKPETVIGSPLALCSLRISPGDGVSLLTVQVMADRNGKCGAAQVVHAMNVMAGFEESIGLVLTQTASR